MAGSGIGPLIDMSRRSLFNTSQSIRVIGNNIANVNTEGYSRRRTELVSSAIGNNGVDSAGGYGADINNIVRVTDKFLNNETNVRIQDRARQEVRDQILSRAEVFFPVSSDSSAIGFELSAFFSSLEDLVESPADLSLRQNVISQGDRLTTSIRTTYNGLSELQREADSRIESMVENLNHLTAQVADLNGQIQQSENTDQESLTLRDQRDQVIRDLAELITFESVENSDGSIMVYLPSGFGLVVGATSRALEVTKSPDFAPTGGFPAGLDGGALSHIVYDFDKTSTTAHVDLTSLIGRGGGELGGLLQVRGIQAQTDTSAFDARGDLPEMASMIESLARDLLTRFNTEYLGPDEDSLTANHQASSGDLNANIPTSPYSLFSFVGASDLDANGLPDDLAALGSSLSIQGFASKISMGLSNLEEFAAARDLDLADGATLFTTGDARNVEALIALRDDVVNYNLGAFNQSTTIEQLYDNVTSRVGGIRSQAANSLIVARDRETQVKEFRESVSGVSIDEEFANLILIQKAFQASARMITKSDELLTEIINLAN